MSRCFRWRHNIRQSWWYRWRDHHHLVAPNDIPTNFNFPQDTPFYPKVPFGIHHYTPENPLYPTGGHVTIDIPLYLKTIPYTQR